MRIRAVIAAVALAASATSALAVAPVPRDAAHHRPTAGAGAAGSATGFAQPYAGVRVYEGLAPRVATSVLQVNRPLGTARATRIARALGLSRATAFTRRQYRLFVTGKGVGGDPASAKLVDESVRILTNTTGRPLYSDVDGTRTATVLASYGLMVSTDGWLQSPANVAAPTRQVNAVIAPGGYMGRWARANGAADALAALYRSAYTPEVPFGARSQKISGAAQLVPISWRGTDTTVGMPMAPSIWIVNFALIWTLNPDLAAKMPARWTPIPDTVVQALEASPDGRVPYAEYAAVLPG